MSLLIDSFMNDKTDYQGKWYVARPLMTRDYKVGLRIRLKWALEVLAGKAIAVHFKEDEEENRKG